MTSALYGTMTEEAFGADDEAILSILGNDLYKLTPGEHLLRFLPPAPGEKSSFRITAGHYLKSRDETEVAFLNCPRVEKSEPCPVCQLANDIRAHDKKLAQSYDPRLSVLANVVNQQSSKRVPQVLRFGYSIWKELKQIWSNPKLGGKFTDPTSAGCDIIIHRVGTGLTDTAYTVRGDIAERVPLASDGQDLERILTMRHNLEAYIDTSVSDTALKIIGDVPRNAPAVVGASFARNRPAALGSSDDDIPFAPIFCV